jgi:sirohydrochlorin ferrochelatase
MMNEQSKTALLVMVHGSPRPSSNADMFTVVERVRARGLFGFVQVGFMELNEPDIPAAIESCVESGADKVVAVPYFLHAGTHVADDLPGLLEDAARRHPGVTFLMGDFLGHDPLIADVVRDRAAQAQAG